jgi:hypothetical protein
MNLISVQFHTNPVLLQFDLFPLPSFFNNLMAISISFCGTNSEKWEADYSTLGT